jgi:type IV pilus assembly protein PilE
LKLRSLNNNKGFSLIELLVVIAIIGILAAVGIPTYVGYVSGTQKTNAMNEMQAIYMVQEEYKASSTNNAYYGDGNSCSPSLTGNTNINTHLFGGKAQLDTSDPKFYFCIASGDDGDGGFKIFTERPDGTDEMTLNANNGKTGW